VHYRLRITLGTSFLAPPAKDAPPTVTMAHLTSATRAWAVAPVCREQPQRIDVDLDPTEIMQEVT
jgi:hypothetical protein